MVPKMGLNRINIKVSCSNMIENIDDKKDIGLILDCKRAMAMDNIPFPDIEEERKRFWEKQKQIRSSVNEVRCDESVKMAAEALVYCRFGGCHIVFRVVFGSVFLSTFCGAGTGICSR